MPMTRKDVCRKLRLLRSTGQPAVCLCLKRYFERGPLCRDCLEVKGKESVRVCGDQSNVADAKFPRSAVQPLTRRIDTESLKKMIHLFLLRTRHRSSRHLWISPFEADARPETSP